MIGSWIVAYDVTDNRRRYRLARWLRDRGVRLQRSVWQCPADGTEPATLLGELEALIDPGEDSLRMYPVTAASRTPSEFGGPPPVPARTEYTLV
jgi:CRISPR-associated protein Cas2